MTKDEFWLKVFISSLGGSHSVSQNLISDTVNDAMKIADEAVKAVNGRNPSLFAIKQIMPYGL